MKQLVVVGLIGLVAACNAPPGATFGSGANPSEIERVAVLPGSVDVVTAQAVEAMTDLGLQPVVSSPGTFVARTGDDHRWAFCPMRRIRDNDRTFTVRPGNAEVEVAMITRPQGDGTEVEIRAQYAAVYYNRARASYFRGVCNSFGVLEKDFFARLRALNGGGASADVPPTS